MKENLLRWDNSLTFQETFNLRSFQLSAGYKSVAFRYFADKSVAYEKNIPSQLNSTIFLL